MKSIEGKRRRLLELLHEKSYLFRSDPPFKLVSGRESPYYVDCRPATRNAEGISLVGELFFDRIKNLDVQAIGGLTMGADPIADATALTSYLKGKPVNSFSVRKREKGHGVPKMVVGDVKPGDRVVIVEDVMTTGGSTLQAIDEAERFGLQVVKVVVLVDREEGGREAVQRRVPWVDSIVTLSDLKRYDEGLRASR
jgi:orotate phosphoribosyltransferase